MKIIYGIGAPNKIRRSGTEYIDKQTGKRYNQNTYPQGNSWTPIDDDSTDDGGGGTNGVPGVLYYISKELTFSDITTANATSTPILLGEIPSNSDGLFRLCDISILYSGTSINTTSAIIRVVTSTGAFITEFLTNVFTSNSPIDLKSSYFRSANGGSPAIESGLTDVNTELYLQIANTISGGDSSSWAKVYITYLAF